MSNINWLLWTAQVSLSQYNYIGLTQELLLLQQTKLYTVQVIAHGMHLHVGMETASIIDSAGYIYYNIQHIIYYSGVAEGNLR